jgi:hypothetical protein
MRYLIAADHTVDGAVRLVQKLANFLDIHQMPYRAQSDEDVKGRTKTSFRVTVLRIASGCRRR